LSSSVWLAGVSATISTGFYLLSKLRHVRHTKKWYLIKWTKVTMWNCSYITQPFSCYLYLGGIFKNVGLYVCGHTQSQLGYSLLTGSAISSNTAIFRIPHYSYSCNIVHSSAVQNSVFSAIRSD